MDHLTDELERMATNLAQYDGDERGSNIPLDSIGGEPPASHAVPSPARSAQRPVDGTTWKPQKPKANYIMKLGGPLSTASQIQAAAALPAPPALIQGEADDGAGASFCRLPQQAVARLETWLREAGIPSHRRPAFVRLSEAEKELCPHSPCPTLGVDATLPHHRPHSDTAAYRPLQDEYPVWYFFYGTLADPDKLASLFALAEGCERPVLHRAAVRGASVGTWGGKYKALVDGPRKVDGWAYKVMNKEQEDILRAYETEKYEVVRCRIEMEGEDVMGCTFRFVDPESLQGSR
ncbi:hypothetical protein SLS58_001961 [Diplodia intermedia]|uniref:Putative gamma-glutamylcyclotransferase n=1 Tax=Diplodia intermedia TaxID=856260 RepID=A0ABR3U145_9PEZI